MWLETMKIYFEKKLNFLLTMIFDFVSEVLFFKSRDNKALNNKINKSPLSIICYCCLINIDVFLLKPQFFKK
jgi:hypothetical protein